MGYLTKFGNAWGNIPETVGNVYFVSPADSYLLNGLSFSASDDNDGLSPERAIRTIARSIVLATASASDVIALLPGPPGKVWGALPGQLERDRVRHVDLSFLSSEFSEEEYRASRFDPHPSSAVHRRIGEALAAYVREESLIGTR